MAPPSRKMASTLVKEKQRLGKLSAEEWAARRRQLGEMTVNKIRQELKSLNKDEWTGDDSGLLKAKAFSMYGLGEPPKKVWTKAGVVYMLEERGNAYADNEVHTKYEAISTLERVMADGDNTQRGQGSEQRGYGEKTTL